MKVPSCEVLDESESDLLKHKRKVSGKISFMIKSNLGEEKDMKRIVLIGFVSLFCVFLMVSCFGNNDSEIKQFKDAQLYILDEASKIVRTSTLSVFEKMDIAEEINDLRTRIEETDYDDADEASSELGNVIFLSFLYICNEEQLTKVYKEVIKKYPKTAAYIEEVL